VFEIQSEAMSMFDIGIRPHRLPPVIQVLCSEIGLYEMCVPLLGEIDGSPLAFKALLAYKRAYDPRTGQVNRVGTWPKHLGSNCP
jgi:hypothetical protein